MWTGELHSKPWFQLTKCCGTYRELCLGEKVRRRKEKGVVPQSIPKGLHYKKKVKVKNNTKGIAFEHYAACVYWSVWSTLGISAN